MMKSLAAMAALWLLSGCAGEPSTSPRRPEPSPVPATAEPPFFPTTAGPLNAYLDAGATGRIGEEDGCVLLDPGPDLPMMLVIWPHGWGIEPADREGWRIVDDAGAEMLTLGDRIHFGGGVIGETGEESDFVEEVIGERIPDRCKPEGGFWLGAPDVNVLEEG